MTSPFIPMDTPNPPPTDSAAPDATGLPHVCVPDDATPAATPQTPAPAVDPGAVTTARLRAGLAARLRSAYEQGARLDDLAAACHQPVAEVRELLQLAGVDPDRPGMPSGAGDDGLVPAQRDRAAEPLGFGEFTDGTDGSGGRPRPRVRRPAPSRRSARGGRGAADETGGAGDADVPETGPAVESDGTDGVHAPDARPDAPVAAEMPEPEAPTAPARMGIMIGSAQRAPEPPVRAGDQRRRRVAAQVVKVGSGTTLAVLPSWRSSIAVSVPTELLLEATGLTRQELPEAELTVLINMDALHDRELRMRDWQVGPGSDGGRRSRD
ncbi:hypothetical protein P3T37_007211 [Kitasatospora sp. MAA4]|uniref:hypothetical protein n=1 Tax=Kitasatospora sp. MAA4 TaxID=3035093 RepID=UPI002473E33F|nr:hypothetical protein [Kitasatospora sp. MAA4]MDH6137778.1 hypothetical protein [Kitasatospora sp. MAA4]